VLIGLCRKAVSVLIVLWRIFRLAATLFAGGMQLFKTPRILKVALFKTPRILKVMLFRTPRILKAAIL
jgi:hypothetical protein